MIEEHPDKMGYWRFIWMHLIATLRLSKYAICTMSKGKGHVDYHDYPDDILGEPAHFVTLKCERCGKEFTM